MIKSSTKISNNKCVVSFNFTPQDIKYSRSNYTATHKGGGTTSRLGIWEGIECIEAQVKIGDGAWKTYSLPSNKTVSVEVASNNVKVQAKGKYRLKTMGYYFKCTDGSLPFFWFGNVGGTPYKYQKGSFKDANSNRPEGSFYSINTCVPADWTYVKAEWSDWAYKHAANNSSTQWKFDSGRYAQRNANKLSATYANGWISDSGYKQAYRKSSLFWFEKSYTASATTSGIAVNPGLPVVEVPAQKGDTGKVVLYYKANNSGNGYITVQAKCKDKTVNIMTYNDSPEFGHDWKKTLTPDFNKIFGESYRANDVYYRAKAKNKAGYESAWTGWVGVNRYNGIPSVPTKLKVTGVNGLLYTTAKASWNKSTDPDGDAVVYDIWLKATSPSGTVTKNDIIKQGHSSLNYDINISSYEDGTKFEVKVRANDKLISSNWSSIVTFEKGAKPTSGPALICPVYADTTIYANKQRFGFTYDGESTCVVTFNGVKYDSDSNPDMFAIGTNKFIFKPKSTIPNGNVSISAYFKNDYGVGKTSQTYKFTKKVLVDKFKADDIIKHTPIKDLQSIIIELGKAYKFDSEFALATMYDYYEASQYNNCYNKVLQINNYINKLISDSKFDYTLTTKAAVKNEINSVKLWKELIQDITNM